MMFGLLRMITHAAFISSAMSNEAGNMNFKNRFPVIVLLIGSFRLDVN